MAAVAHLDAIEFFHFGKRNIRVYYQFDDEDAIRESCFDQDHGWYVRENGIVGTNARRNSPVSATRWSENPVTTQVRCSLSPHLLNMF
jgi:hypothetical protein